MSIPTKSATAHLNLRLADLTRQFQAHRSGCSYNCNSINTGVHMAKTSFPAHDTLQPIQTLDFILENGQRAGAVFLPQPDQTGNRVGHVAVALIHAGFVEQSPITPQKRPQTILDAADLAVQFAQAEATRVGSKIAAARLLGEEFLEKSDVLLIIKAIKATNTNFAVTVI